MTHVERRQFFVGDMMEKLEIQVPFVRTDDNIADFFTKPLGAKKFYAMRRKIMNEPEPGTPSTEETFGTSDGPRSEVGRPKVTL